MTASTSSAHKMTLSTSERTTVFALIGAGHTMSHMYILTLPPLFALIKVDLDISYAALGLLVTMFHVSTGLMQVPAGFLVDRFGARITLIVVDESVLALAAFNHPDPLTPFYPQRYNSLLANDLRNQVMLASLKELTVLVDPDGTMTPDESMALLPAPSSK